jgi:aspartate oxidase
VFARRAISRALSDTATAIQQPQPAEAQRLAGAPELPPASAETRAALWSEAGIFRNRESLERLAGDTHPLARLIARCALARTESRGAHLRSDHPATEESFELRHAVVYADELDWQTWT